MNCWAAGPENDMQYLDDEFEKSLPPMGHPLRKLGVRLTELLDEDQWAECERLLLEGWEHDAADRATGARELFTAAQLAPGEGIEDAVGRLADLIAALEEARSAINSMKVEAETAGQGDEQMMLEACETISNEGLQADMAIRAALASAPRPVPPLPGRHLPSYNQPDDLWLVSEAELHAYAAEPAAAGEPVAWMTVNDDGDPLMLFFDHIEAMSYCNEGEVPIELFTADQLAAAVAKERDRCADIADQHASCEGIAQKIADAIRAGDVDD